ncbi:4'-phosphopantetheinyl transferase family protein [Streptomyces tauricus]|uniref:4'-phosphopantetheinyl transferase family protein n=1 Tax=Streptomyces tauricus TaxID=68274 RepID=UPI0033A2FE0E
MQLRPISVAPGDMEETAIRTALTARGSAVVYGQLTAWQPEREDAQEVRAVLGRDWQHFRAIEHTPHRLRYAASRLLAKHVAAAALGADASELELAHGLAGRPSLRGCDQLDISLSHTGGLLLVGLTRRARIGVDVEDAGRRMRGPGPLRGTCTPPEFAALQELPERERDDAFVRLWTLKEAYSKAIGQGLRVPFTTFGFDLREHPLRLRGADGAPAASTAWSFHTDELHAGGSVYRTGIAVWNTG